MTYYPDLSEYAYRIPAFHPGTRNIGWLGIGHEFGRAEPSDEILSKLWGFCKVAIARTRGLHTCEFCTRASYYFERDRETLLLGSAEIRVFSPDGHIYAAPNLIYHYMIDHKYKPPDEFVRAMNNGPAPTSQEYLDRIEELGLAWRRT